MRLTHLSREPAPKWKQTLEIAGTCCQFGAIYLPGTNHRSNVGEWQSIPRASLGSNNR
jgi:hypothetical protein